MKITMSLSDDSAIRRLRNSGTTFNRACETFLSVAGQMVVGKAKENTPVANGQLRQSIEAKKPRKLAGTWQTEVGSGLEYAKYQEFGTGIYGPLGRPITPKRAKMLAWKSKSGQMVFAKSVRGSKKREFMKKGIEAVKKNINVAFDQMDKVIQSEL